MINDSIFINVNLFSFLLMIDSKLVVSSDYLEALEIGMESVDGSQYEIMPCFQEFMDKYVKSYNPKIKEYL